jgi:hypothetical protein
LVHFSTPTVLPRDSIVVERAFSDAVFPDVFEGGDGLVGGDLVSHDEDNDEAILFVRVYTDANVAGHSVEKLYPVFLGVSTILQQKLTNVFLRLNKAVESQLNELPSPSGEFTDQLSDLKIGDPVEHVLLLTAA